MEIDNYTIYLNRGDELVIGLNRKNDTWKQGDKFKFSIVKEGNYEAVLFQKEFVVNEDTTHFEILLTKEETLIDKPLKSGQKVFYYEIEYNGNNTILGADKDGDKKLILLPEAGTKTEEI